MSFEELDYQIKKLCLRTEYLKELLPEIEDVRYRINDVPKVVFDRYIYEKEWNPSNGVNGRYAIIYKDNTTIFIHEKND